MEQAVKTRSVKPFWRGAWAFFLGFLCFTVSQLLTRIPLLNLLQSDVHVTVFVAANALLYLVFLALSAGIFEEGFRFLFKHLLLRPAMAPFSQPILFGLGHGLCEAAFVLIPLAIQGYTLGDLWLAILERALTVVLHICLTVVVFNGFQKGRKWLYLIIAVLLHAAVDFVFPVLATMGFSALLIEALYAIFVVPCAVYAARSKKYYLCGGTQHV
jgi:uncharacterized membrane protein YhfC